MGRLYKKFFLFFFLAQLTTTLGVGVAIWWQHYLRESNLKANLSVEQSPPARSVVQAAALTLQYGGVDGLKALLTIWQKQTEPQVFVVDQHGVDIFQRAVDKVTLDAVTALAKTGRAEQAVRQVQLDNGAQYLLFVPNLRAPSNPQPASQQTPPPASDQDAAFDELPPPPPDGAMHAGAPAPQGYFIDSQNGRGELRPRHIFPLVPILAGVLVSLIFAALLARYISKPIKSLSNAFQEAANGRLEVRVGDGMSHRKDELADLGRDFDAMATRLGMLLQSQMHLLDHVSHELRSPLARMQMAIGLAKQSEDKVASSLERIQRESERMDKLVGELLQLSRLESGVMTLKKETIQLSNVLDSVCEDATFEANAKNIHIDLQMPVDVMLFADVEMLHAAIENVVRNAIKYSPNDTSVSIATQPHPQNNLVLVVINDQGPGVLEEELTTIFEPFVRSVTTAHNDGHGVGLALAKQVVVAHGGSIVAKNQAAGGLSVQITLPYA